MTPTLCLYLIIFAIAGGINALIEKLVGKTEKDSDKELMLEMLQAIIFILAVFSCFALRYVYMTNVL